MQRILSKLATWELDRKDEDIRGWPLCDADGRKIGTVSELIADTDTRCVTQVVLGDGRRIRAHDLYIGDHVLTVASAAPTAEKRPREAAAQVPAAAAAAATKGNGDAKVRDLAARRAKAAAPAMPATVPATDDLIIPLIDEEIEVSKRKVDAGGVRVETHVVSKPVREEVRLREEHVSVERRRLDEPITAADADEQLRDRAVEMTATSEIPVVAKRVHAIEEIVLKKERTERVQQVKDSLRHTDVEVAEIPVKNRPKV